MRTTVENIIGKYSNDKYRLMDILLDVQKELKCIPDEAVEIIANGIGVSKVDVEQPLSFYHFFSKTPVGDYAIYLNNSAVACMYGRDDVAQAFEEEAGITFGSVTEDGKIGLFDTADIGMNDQEPAAIINGKVFTNLTPAKARSIVADMKAGKAVDDMITEFGDGNNAAMKTMVFNNIRKKGDVIFSEYENGAGIKKIVGLTPNEVINEVKNSYIRGRGGAGFPTGLKWDFCRQAEGDERFILCNADEGEPGTFKERTILTEVPKLLFEGMAIGGYAIGAKQGILYLRNEYEYMVNFLEAQLDEMRAANLLGTGIAGKEGFDFDIRIQLGAGAYVCGEESALIESCEGKRGEPRNRPPFPVQKGYMNKPTVVNNVETLCSVVKILMNGSEWYNMMGSRESSGTKLLSISGDCKYPGVYEIEWGLRVRDMLEMVGAEDTQAVQVGGPSGICIGPKDFKRTIAYEDLPTGGAIIIIGSQRNLIKDVVLNYCEFFIDESCGSCAPCRTLQTILKHKVEKIVNGNGVMADLDELKDWASKMKPVNRCGLGQTAANPILTTLENFRELYEDLLLKDVEYETGFDLAASVQESCEVVGRVPNL